MKKICIFLCITVLMLSVSAVAFAGDEISSSGGASLSVPAVYIVPAEKEPVSVFVSEHSFIIPCGNSAVVCIQCISAVDKYTPEIMEQIDIISVAPRE